MKKFILILAAFSAFVISSCQSLPENFDASKLGQVERDITYCVMDGVELKMDVRYPLTQETKWPVIIHVHGGGWTSGKKAFAPLADAENLPGFMAVTVEYRLAPEYKFPAMLEDVKCAVRYLRANAKKYNIDPERFGAIGGSAGGHIVAMLGLADATAGFDVGEYLNYPSNVQAVVDLFGSSNLAPPYTTHLFFDPEYVFGISNENDPIFIKYSPVHYVSADSPPFLLIHGERDTTIPPLQSSLLYEELKNAGAPAKLILVQDAGHNLQHRGKTEDIIPSREALKEEIQHFFTKYLR